MENNHHWMTEEEYKLVTEKTPIPTVDLVILRQSQNKNLETLLIRRKTGYEKGKWCIIGGRQWKNETLMETIERQAADLEIKVEIMKPFDPNFPALVNDHPNQDETKQPTCIVYPVIITEGSVRDEGEEYKGYQWFPVNELPEEIAYDHRFEITQTLERVEKLKTFT